MKRGILYSARISTHGCGCSSLSTRTVSHMAHFQAREDLIMTNQPPGGGWSQGPQPPIWQSPYGPNQPYPTIPQQPMRRTHRPQVEWIRFGVGAALMLCGVLTLLSLMLSMVTLHASNVREDVPQSVSIKPFKGIDAGIVTDAMSADAHARPFVDGAHPWQLSPVSCPCWPHCSSSPQASFSCCVARFSSRPV